MSNDENFKYRRLTDRKTAEKVRQNMEGLREKGMDISISDERYVRLAAFENLMEDESIFFILEKDADIYSIYKQLGMDYKEAKQNDDT